MKNPSITQTVLGVAITSGILFAGAIIASKIPASSETTTSLIDQEQGVVSQSTQTNTDTRPSLAGAPGLAVSIQGVRNNSGTVFIAVFDSATAYAEMNYEKVAALAEVPAQSGLVEVRFSNLSGTGYVVSTFHDENKDGTFNMLGEVPLEGYGTSGASGPYDTPSYSNARITARNATVQMHYLY
jgi:uncharacterized protein (DUF2141 family)